MKPLIERRDAALKVAIAGAIRAYVASGGERACATCGTRFAPRQRYHFFCGDQCRKAWYMGQFRPRRAV